MQDPRPALERARIAQLFERHPARTSFIGREVAQRMGERLAYIRVDPQRLLDAGCGSGADGRFLAGRFPQALLVGADLSPASLQLAQRPGAAGRRWIGSLLRARRGQLAAVATDFAHLPFANASFDMIWSNLAIHWDDQPHRTFVEWARVLAPGSLVMFSAFGPDTLAEVRHAFACVDDDPHTLAFTDMHDYGDMLVAGGFATPVVDMEHITLTYTRTEALWDDVRALGGNPLARRRRALWGPARRARWSRALEEQRDGDGRWRLTFEVLYGHAWKGIPRLSSDGRAIVRFDRLPHHPGPGERQ